MGLCQAGVKSQYINEKQIKAVQKDDSNFINLKYQNLDDDELMKLCKGNTGSIVQLNLAWNKITYIGIEYFAQANWKNLKLLQLWHNFIGDKGCKLLTKATLQQLQALGLTEGKIGCAGMLHLSKGRWSKLNKLDLGENKITGEAVEWIVKTKFDKLQFVSLKQLKISNDQFQCILKIASHWQGRLKVQNLPFYYSFKIEQLFKKIHPKFL